MKAKIASLIGLVTLIANPVAVSAHAVAPPLPLHHIFYHHAVNLVSARKFPTSVSTNAALLKSLTKTKTFAFPVNLGSGANAALNKQLKLIASTGFTAGQSAGIVSQAVVQNGVLQGTIYVNFGSPTLMNIGRYTQVFGNNPLNDQVNGTTSVTNFGATNIFSLASTSTNLAKGSKMFVDSKLFPTAASGAQRAYLNLFKGVSKASILAGERSAQLPGTVLGGVFYGRYYLSNGGNYYQAFYPSFAFTFGNRNNGASTLSTAGLKSFIEFSNGKTEVITNASLYSTIYQPGLKYPFYEALGSNPLNSAGGAAFYPSSYKSYVYF